MSTPPDPHPFADELGRLSVGDLKVTDAKHAAPSRRGFDEKGLSLLGVTAEAVALAMERAWSAGRWAAGRTA